MSSASLVFNARNRELTHRLVHAFAEADGNVVRIPADYPYELVVIAGVTPQPASRRSTTQTGGSRSVRTGRR